MTKMAKQSEPLKVETWAVEKVVPYIRNPRKNAGIPVAKVKASLKEFGWRQPIVVDSEGVIIVGHTRYQAALELGMTEIPVHVAEGLTAAQVKAYRIADNKTGDFAEWDFDLLKLEFADLQELDFGLDLTGFDDDAIDGIMVDSTPEGLTDPDEVPDVPEEPVSKPGDVWVMGNHRLMCGDSTSVDAFKKLVGPTKADMIFTDPPYGMSYGGGRARGDDQKFKGRPGGIKSHGMILGDDLQGDSLIALVRDAIASSITCTKEGAPLYACFTWRTYAEFEAALESLGREIKACIVWDKKSIGLGNSHYRPQHEFIFYCGGHWHGDKSQADVWHMSRGATGDYVHPTQKPVELVEKALNNSSKSGDMVVDCFGGSGSTLIACEKLHRHARLMELDPKYCDVIVKRWEDFTGKKAVLEVTNAEG